jgi:hypothetical protein
MSWYFGIVHFNNDLVLRFQCFNYRSYIVKFILVKLRKPETELGIAHQTLQKVAIFCTNPAGNRQKNIYGVFCLETIF